MRAIPRIERRIEELRQFDVSSVDDRADPRIQVLSNRLDSLLVSVFGAGTIEYDRHHWPVTNLDTAGFGFW